MKLPDFEAFEPFLDLKKRMDARAPVEFTAEFSARQISNDNFATAETVVMPELGDFVVERIKLVPETPNIETIKPEIAPPLVEAAEPRVELETNLDVVPDVAMPEPLEVLPEPEVKAEPRSRAKLRPARKKIKTKQAKIKKERTVSRSTLALTLTASGIIILNAVLLWAFFGYLASLSESKEESKPLIAKPQPVQDLPKKLEEVPPKQVQAMPEIPPAPKPNIPEPTLAEPEPPPPVVQPPEPELAKPQPIIEPEPVPAPAEPVQAVPAPVIEAPPAAPPVAEAPRPYEPTLSEAPQPTNVFIPEQAETNTVMPPENPRPSIFDGQGEAGLPPAGGIGGVGAGWDGQGQGGAAQGVAGLGGIGGVGAPGARSGKKRNPVNLNVKVRRVYVRHYVPITPPPPEDIPADQLPWQEP